MSRWPILALVTAAHGLGALSVLAVAPLAPFLLEALHVSRAQVGWFLPAVYLGGVLMWRPAGWLTDRLGVRATLGLGQLVIGVGVILAALGANLAACLVCLVFAGFGFSVLNPATGKAVVEWFPPRRRRVAMGIKQTGPTPRGHVRSCSVTTVPPPVLLSRRACRSRPANDDVGERRRDPLDGRRPRRRCAARAARHAADPGRRPDLRRRHGLHAGRPRPSRRADRARAGRRRGRRGRRLGRRAPRRRQSPRRARRLARSRG